VFEAVTKVLRADPRISYGLVFGSRGRGTARADSDLDVAIGGLSTPLATLELGDLIGRLEVATGHEVDLVLLDEAGPGLAWRVFKDGVVVLERDPASLADRKAWAALEYFDWKPVEDLFAGVPRSPTLG
jgi:predicted nucleotidyltransferase